LKFNKKTNFEVDKVYLDVWDLLQDSTICLWQIIFYTFDRNMNIGFWDIISTTSNDQIDFADKLMKICIDNQINNPFDKSWLSIKVVSVNCLSKLLINFMNIFDSFVKPDFKIDSVKKFLKLYTLLITDPIFDKTDSKTKAEYIQNK